MVWLGLVVGVQAGEFQVAAPSCRHNEKPHLQALIHRELARQGLWIAALHGPGVAVYDPLFDAYREPGAAVVPELGLEWKVKTGEFVYAFVTPRGERLEGVAKLGEDETRWVEDQARELAGPMTGAWREWVAGRFSSLGERGAGAAGTLLSETERVALEARTDPLAQWRLVRHWHGVAERDGVSAAALAGLAMHYQALAEATRPMWNAWPIVCSARAFLYAAWLERAYPGDARVLETRAWVLGQSGRFSAALPLLEELRARSGAPVWVALLEDAARFRTAALVERARAGGREAEWAAVLALQTAELRQAPNFYAQLWADFGGLTVANPRVVYGARTVLHGHGRRVARDLAAEEWQLVLQRVVPELPGLPAELARVIQAADKNGRPAFRAFFEAARARPDAGPVAWGSLGRMLWDMDLSVTLDRFGLWGWWWAREDEDARLAVLDPYAGHPQAGLLGSLWKGKGEAPGAGLEKVALGDVVEAMQGYTILARETGKRFADRTTTRAENEVWWSAAVDGHAQARLNLRMTGFTLPRNAPYVLAHSPYHPQAMADLILEGKHPGEAKEFADELLPGHPLVAWAVGKRRFERGRAGDALGPLSQARAVYDEAELMELLADARLATGDEAGWLAERLAYAEIEDSGDGHARNRNAMAKHYLLTRRPALARPQALAAVGEGEWRLGEANLLLSLAALGEQRELQARLEGDAEGERASLSTRLEWWAIAGAGERAALEREVLTRSDGSRYQARDLDLIGRYAAAAGEYLANVERTQDSYGVPVAALAALEAGDRSRARAILAGWADAAQAERYKSATALTGRELGPLFLSWLEEKPAPGVMVEALEKVLKKHGLPRGRNRPMQMDLRYFLGRFLRLEGHRAEARAQLEAITKHPDWPTPSRFAFPLIAVEFRHHGVDLVDRFRPEQ